MPDMNTLETYYKGLIEKYFPMELKWWRPRCLMHTGTYLSLSNIRSLRRPAEPALATASPILNCFQIKQPPTCTLIRKYNVPHEELTRTDAFFPYDLAYRCQVQLIQWSVHPLPPQNELQTINLFNSQLTDCFELLLALSCAPSNVASFPSHVHPFHLLAVQYSGTQLPELRMCATVLVEVCAASVCWKLWLQQTRTCITRHRHFHLLCDFLPCVSHI